MNLQQTRRIFLLCICLPVIFLRILPGNAGADEPESPVLQSATGQAIITKEKVVELKVGEKVHVLTEAKILGVAVTKPEVAEGFTSGEQELLLIANGPGVAKVILSLSNGGTVAYIARVYVADPAEYAGGLKEKLKGIQNLNIQVVKEKILVEGRVLYLKDMDAIERAIGDNPSVINLTSLSSRNARILAREIERELRESGIYGVEVEVRKKKVTLVGTLASDVLVRKAEHIASSYTPNYVSLLQTKKVSEQALTSSP